MTDVTRVLFAIEQGDPHAAEQLLPLVYDELRKLAAQKLAREKPGQTLQATALVHEAYMRLVGTETAQRWDSRGHFFAAAAEAMRRILVDRARDRKRLKRGGGRGRVDLDEALTELGREDPLCARLVALRFFAGLTQAEGLGKSPGQADARIELADGKQSGIAGELAGRRLDHLRCADES